MNRIISMIKHCVERYPDRSALTDMDGGSLTYAELDMLARRVAARLVRQGVQPRDYVTVELPRCREYIAAELGVWYAGAAYAPLSDEYPEDRLGYIRSNCSAAAVINERFMRGIELEAPLSETVDTEESFPALLNYTSGSTGRPKGVMHDFLSISDAVGRFNKLACFDGSSRYAAGSPLTFIVSSQMIWSPLSCGTEVFLVPFDTMRDPELLSESFERFGITHSFISPKMLKMFRQRGSSLKMLFSGGERVSDSFSDDYEICCLYGQTETTAAVTAFRLDKQYSNTPVGKALDGIYTYVLDEQGNEAREGELCVTGHLASGYLGLPEQTAKTFVPNPFRERDGMETMIRTGDIVRLDENDNIVYLNRRDWMVKINGQRVEPGEIETVLKAVDGVDEAAVKDFKNQYGQVYLTAYYVGSESIGSDYVRSCIADKLPDYMLPAFFVRLGKLPLNANGKLDRAALPEPEAGSFKAEYAAPSTDMQRALCAAFEKILGVEGIGIDDSFLALGGDSIRSAAAAAECAAFGIHTADIFAGKTPRGIEQLMLGKASSQRLVRKQQRESVYPLTPYERGMYLEQKMSPDSTVYLLDLIFSISGADSGRVTAALGKVFAAHEAFHSYYSERSGRPVRVVTNELPEISIASAASREEAAALAASYAVPFDLNAGIPVRAFVYEHPNGIVLHIAIHHIAFDGGSAGTLFRELTAALEGRELDAPELDLSDLYEQSLDREPDSGLGYYRTLFADGVPVNDLPIRGKRPKIHPLSDRELVFAYSCGQLTELDRAAKRFGITEFELIFAAAALTAARYSGTEDIVLGIPTNMRPAEAEDVIGMFVNTAPVRVRPVRKAALSDYLSQTSTAVRQVTYGADLPFEDVVREFVKQRDESRNPMFDISVNYMTMPDAYERDGLRVELDVPLQKMSRDIGIVIRKDNSGLKFMLQYSSELFDDVIIENFAEQLRHTVKLIAEGAGTVGEAAELPDRQREQLMSFSCEARADIPVTLLHKLFEKAAAGSPDKTALIAVDDTLTFRQLDERANIAANGLISRGVGIGDSVAILLPRVSAFFACMFGVNKAGAAFIPCDPQYPADRINHIISDSGAAFIITTSDKLADYPADKAIDVSELLSGSDVSSPDTVMSDSELSYMIYTSGSTGKPKGVMLHHRGICNYLLPHPANPHMRFISENVERYLSVTTVSFDMSFKEHAAALCNGKTLIFAGDSQMNDPRELARLMEEYGADCINATPSRLAQYMEYEPFRRALARCRLVMSGGEGYPMSLRDRLSECCPDTRIMNTYGPTEITVSCNAADLTNADHISVGRPLLNYTEYIVDRFGSLAPYGAVGELLIGGVGVARGYRNLEKMTAERFIDYHGERVYRSGDYARWDSSGNVMILGRLDNQVKLRGLRIELDEIIGLIEAQEHIKKAAVVIRKISGQENLCAYFTADTQIDIEALRAELKKHLTHYMVPTAYLQMAEMPMTPNGKTDLKRLPEPTPVNAGEYAEPAGDTERFFCEAFGKALKLDRVGAEDDFFEIGGTSLIVTSVVLAASENGFPLTYGDVFKYTTPRALARLFSDDSSQQSGSLFDFDSYDYSKINALLSENTIESFVGGESRELGNIMITGATGYMGAHLLAQYLDEENGIACCMVRKGKYRSSADRLKNMLFYYFGRRYNDVFNERVKVFDGDVTDYKSFEQFEDMPINTVFNCAANVKHFSSGTDIEDINVGGAVNCIKLCEKLGARLIHFSTISVSGTTDDMSKLARSSLDEQSLYFGQTNDNKYTASKLMGERKVLEAAAERGLDAKVIRVGTLAARESDGEFQINFLTNSFMGRLRSYSMLGCFPYQMIENQVCMGPIDVSCRAFLKLARTPKSCCLFNAVNNHTLPLGDIIRRMNAGGMDIRFVEYEEFSAAIAEAQKDPEKAAILQSMVAYMAPSQGRQVMNIPFTAHYTTQVLARLGFFWNASNERYVDDFINVLGGFSFFDSDNLGR